MDFRTLRLFEREVRNHCPEFRLGYKDESFLQRLLGFLNPLNPGFMSKTSTTIYPTVYFPSKKHYQAHPWSSFMVLAHSLVHLLYVRDKPIWARLSYFLPQLLAFVPFAAYVYYEHWHAWPLALLFAGYLCACMVGRKLIGAFYVVALGGVVASGVLAVLLTHWWSALFFSGVALLAPWPSPWRTGMVTRAYSMNLAITFWALGRVPEIYRTGITCHFTGASYYFTDWSGVNTRKRLDQVVAQAQTGQLGKEHPFSVVYSFMRRHGLLHHAR